MTPDAVRRWLGLLDGEGVTDLHLKPGSPPKLRRKGTLEGLNDEQVLSRDDVDSVLDAVVTASAAKALATTGQGSCTLSVAGLGRFRVRAQRQRGSTLVVVRRIADTVPSLAELGLLDTIERLIDVERGIVLVGGPPRSGRRSTLASIIDHLNRTRAVHLVAVEHPVEILHRDIRASVSQLEVGVDTPSFAAGVRAAVAADGDVVAVSDVDDAESVEAVLEAVEDGALVIAGIDGDGAAQLVEHFIAHLVPDRREAARIALAGGLVGTLSQRLAPRAGDTGRVPVVEVVRATPKVREALLDSATVATISGLAEIGFVDAVVTLLASGFLDLRGALTVIDDWQALHEAMQARGVVVDAQPAPEALPPLPRRIPG